MRDSPTQYLSLLHHSREQTDTLLRQTDDPGRRAAGVAATLRTLWPESPVFALRLQPPPFPLRAYNGSGAERPEWLSSLDAFLSRYEIAHPGPRALAPLPAELSKPGHSLAVQPVVVAGQPDAVLLVALRDDTPSEKADLFWDVLEFYGEQLGTLLALDAACRAASRRQQEFAQQTEMADLAALASPVTHEFNNFLNTLILQLMVLANQVPEQFRADLRTIGQQAKGVASLVRQWQQHRGQHRAAPRPLNVNALIAEVVAWLAETTADSATPLVPAHDDQAVPAKAVALRATLADDLPRVEGAPFDLRLLVRLLIGNAAATITAQHGAIQVSTERHGDAVLISVEDNGPSLPEAVLPRMFELAVETREGANQLELAACEALVQRRLRGRIHAENRPAGGVAVRVQLRPV